MLDVSGAGSVGRIEVVTSNNKGHSIEEVAQMAVNKIISISDNAPDPIKAQAQSFRDTIKQTLVYYMTQAVEQDRATICAKLRSSGYSDLADNIRSL